MVPLSFANLNLMTHMYINFMLITYSHQSGHVVHATYVDSYD